MPPVLDRDSAVSRGAVVPPPADRFERDKVWHRGQRGTVLVAGSPATFFRVTGTGATILDAFEADAVLPTGHEALTDRLVFTGAVHPVAGEPWPDVDLTVVVPVRRHGDDHALEGLVTGLAPLRVIVVDDASPVPVVLDDDGGRVSVLRLEVNVGPAAARNHGLAAVDTEAVTFVDADVVVDATTLSRLASHLHRERVVAAAPRVRGLPGAGAVARHEERACPLDMGPEPSWVRHSARVRYVPSACMVARTDAIRGAGGFDESMRTGEDVDLVWRLADAGHLVRYDPAFIAFHRARSTLRSALAQRLGYGRSAAALARRHGSAVAPFRSNLVDAAALVALAAGAWLLGLIVLSGSFAGRLARLLRLGAPLRAAVALTRSSAVALISHAAAALVRTWFPLLVAGALLSTRAVPVALAALLVRAGAAVRTSGPAAASTAFVLGPLGDLAYCAGVWRGTITSRSVRALLPVITWRPGSGR